MRQEILAGPERRRRWSSEQKIAIVMEAAQGRESVASVARRHDITRQHIYQWRTAMRRGELGGTQAPGFLEVQIDAEKPASLPGSMPFQAESETQVEIALRNGRAIRIALAVPDAVLVRLIRVVEAA